MAYEMKNNTGSLFRNDKKTTDKHPQAKGRCLIDGTEYWVSAWTRTRENGEKWQALSFTPVDESQQAPKREQQPATSDGEFPF